MNYRAVLPTKNPATNTPLYTACITEEAPVEPVRIRHHPKADPAAAIISKCLHDHAYCGPCSKAKGTAPIRMPGIGPSDRVADCCNNPRKKISSTTGPIEIANKAIHGAELGSSIKSC